MAQPALKVLVISEFGESPKMVRALEEIVASLPRLVAFTGKDCQRLEDACDEFCERTEQGSNIVTTCHPTESLQEVQEFVASWDESEIGRDFLTLII